MLATLTYLLLQYSPVFADTSAYNVNHYAQECEKELGAPVPGFECLKSEIIPVNDSDQKIEITDQTHKGYHTVCDHPSLLRKSWHNYWGNYPTGFNPCVPYTRVGKHVAPSGAEFVWTCRRYFVRDKNSPIYDDINMIGHNPKTGATCFFVSRINRTEPTPYLDHGIDGTKVPAPDTAAGIGFWKSPREMTEVPARRGGSQKCVECHDNDVFIHSPFIRQVRVNDEPIVPSHPKGPYYVVGSQYFNRPAWQNLKHLVSDEAKACTKCHRIGNQRTCLDLALYSTGLDKHPHQTKISYQNPWMPEGDGEWPVIAKHFRVTAEKVDLKYLKAARFVNECCKKPLDSKCKWASVPNRRPAPSK